ncbi:MAG: tetratricopeptide repeat protein [Myxococcota bacterium]
MWTLLLAAGCGWLGARFAGAPTVCAPGAPDACLHAGEALLRASPPDLAGAASRFEQACTDGQLRACTSLGVQVQDGRGVPRDPDRAAALYEQACAGGLGVGCLNLAWLHQTGNAGVADDEAATEDYGRALDRFRASCARPEPWREQPGGPTDCANLGLVLEAGFGVTLPDPQGAHEAYALGCEHGEADACTNLALNALERGDPDVGAAVDRLTGACRDGSGAGCAALGQVLLRGQVGIPADPERAVGLLTEACDLAYAQGCTALAQVLGQGEAPADPDRARAAAARACALGDSTGCMVLGYQAAEARAFDRAAERFTAACHIGAADGCAMVGALHERGDLGAPDPAAAAVWYTEACRRNDPGACVELLRAGRPLPLNSGALDTFLEEACSHDVAEACSVVPGGAP